MLREELTKPARKLPEDLYLAINAIEDDHPMSAHRLNMLVKIIVTSDDLRASISEKMKRRLLIELKSVVNELEIE